MTTEVIITKILIAVVIIILIITIAATMASTTATLLTYLYYHTSVIPIDTVHLDIINALYKLFRNWYVLRISVIVKDNT